MHHPSCSMSHREESVTATPAMPQAQPNCKPCPNRSKGRRQNVLVPPLPPMMGGRGGPSENAPLHSKKPPCAVTSAFTAERDLRSRNVAVGWGEGKGKGQAMDGSTS